MSFWAIVGLKFPILFMKVTTIVPMMIPLHSFVVKLWNSSLGFWLQLFPTLIWAKTALLWRHQRIKQTFHGNVFLYQKLYCSLLLCLLNGSVFLGMQNKFVPSNEMGSLTSPSKNRIKEKWENLLVQKINKALSISLKCLINDQN